MVDNFIHWINFKFCKIVRVGNRYGIRRKFLFSSAYLDLQDIAPKHTVNGGSMYGSPKPTVKRPKIHWWTVSDHISQYGLSDDLEIVLEAYEALEFFKKPKPIKLPAPEEVDNVDMELAQYKLSGKAIRKRFDYAE